jgi:acyl-coenzyme A thioesterase PaaI-like protein
VTDFESQVRAARAAEITPRRQEMRRAGQALRRIIDKFVATKAPIEELTKAGDLLEQVAEALAPWPQGRVFEGFAESSTSGDPHAFFDNSPIMGLANPLAPPLHASVEDGKVVASVVFGAAYEGPPGCVHGGYVAAAFDELLGMTQAMTGKHGMTGTLTIRYRAPTPLHRPLRMVGEIVSEQGRKILTVGRCYLDDTVTAEAEGLFVTVDFARIAELYLSREASNDEGDERGDSERGVDSERGEGGSDRRRA